ncbi:MAG: hypothetical protein GY822_32795 [Deltaproteobacteria bacterium]|nr:hypothetical protein [Deltaproteobacteria bacterium]
MAESAMEGLGKGLDRSHPVSNTPPFASQHRPGSSLAPTPAPSPTTSTRTPGLLSARQISDYHHDVFAKFALPEPSTAAHRMRWCQTSWSFRWAQACTHRERIPSAEVGLYLDY